MLRHDFINVKNWPPQFEGEWVDFTSHIGPVDYETPLARRLKGKTYCGSLSLCAGVVLWCAARLKEICDVSALQQLAEVMFAYQEDWRYFNAEALPGEIEPDQPMAKSVVIGVKQLVGDAMNARVYWNSYNQPNSTVFHITHVTGYIMPPECFPNFEAWLFRLNDRLNAMAPKPDEPPFRKRDFSNVAEFLAKTAHHRGRALPPEVLDVDRPFDLSSQEDLVRSFLAALDWRDNPYLRSPESMKDLGFAGKPYS